MQGAAKFMKSYRFLCSSLIDYATRSPSLFLLPTLLRVQKSSQTILVHDLKRGWMDFFLGKVLSLHPSLQSFFFPSFLSPSPVPFFFFHAMLEKGGRFYLRALYVLSNSSMCYTLKPGKVLLKSPHISTVAWKHTWDTYFPSALCKERPGIHQGNGLIHAEAHWIVTHGLYVCYCVFSFTQMCSMSKWSFCSTEDC